MAPRSLEAFGNRTNRSGVDGSTFETWVARGCRSHDPSGVAQALLAQNALQVGWSGFLSFRFKPEQKVAVARIAIPATGSANAI